MHMGTALSCHIYLAAMPHQFNIKLLVVLCFVYKVLVAEKC